MHWLRWGSIFACALAISAANGCGGHGASVGGKVTLNGSPLTRGTVSFYPTGGGAAATGSVQPDGAYAISTGRGEGLKPGDYVATVFANEAVPVGGPEIVPKVLTPAIYGDKNTSPLKFNIKAGDNSIDLPLTGAAP